MDEKASDVAWSAWKGSAELTYRERLDVAITAYEQARERVAVPSRAELHDVIADHYDQDDYVAARLADALFVFLSKSPATSARPWTRDDVINRMAAAIAPCSGANDMARAAFEAVVEPLLTAPAPSAQPESVIINGVSMPYSKAMRNMHESHKEACLRYAEQIRNLEKRAKRAEDQAGKARCERDEAEAIRNLAVEREQEAEKRAANLEAKTASAIQQKTQAERERDNLDAELATVLRDRYECERELVSCRELHERDVASASEAKRIISEQTSRANAARKRAAELDRERDEARAKLEGETSKRIATEQHLAASSRKQQRTSMALAVARTELGEARGALSELADHFDHMGKRDPAPALHSTPWEYCARYCREAAIQSALAKESAKPASWLREVIDEAKSRDVPMSDYAEREIAKIRAGTPRHNAFGDSHTDYFAQQEMLAQKALAKHPGGYAAADIQAGEHVGAADKERGE